MNSYKVLIILTVIFYIITYCNGNIQDTKGIEVDLIQLIKETVIKGYKEKDIKGYNVTEWDLIKLIGNTKDYKACTQNLIEIGFHRDSGYCMLLYVLQFIKDNPQNDEKFLKHVKEMLDITQIDVDISSEEVDQTSTNTKKEVFLTKYDIMLVIKNYLYFDYPITINPQKNVSTTPVKVVTKSTTSSNDQTKIEIARFIYSFYKDASKVNFKNLEKWITPSISCAFDWQRKQKNSGCFSGLAKKLFGADESKEEKKKFIEDCKKSISKFSAMIDGKEYKFDENNIFRSVITSMDLVGMNHRRDVMDILENMEEHQHNYFEWMTILSKYFETEYQMLNKSLLCCMYAYKKSLENQKSSEIKED